MNSYYFKAERLYNKRRKDLDYKRISCNQVMKYDQRRDCYQHRHHRTVTVEIFRDKFIINTGGWDTITTWTKIGQWAPLRAWRKLREEWEGTKYVYWGGHGWRHRCATAYYDHIEIDVDGVPLDPKPIEVRKLRPGATKPFIEMKRRVRNRLRLAAIEARMVIGELPKPGGSKDRAEVLAAVERLDEWCQEHGEVFIPSHVLDMSALFGRREKCSFGRPTYHQPPAGTLMQRLETNLNAARHAWVEDNGATDIVQMPCDYLHRSE